MTLSRIPSLCVVSVVLSACVATDPENLGELESSSSASEDTSPSGTGMSSTTVEPTTNEPSTTAQPTTEGGSETGETGSETHPAVTAESTGETIMCDSDFEEILHFPAGCPDTQSGVQLPAEGCYPECTGLDDACEAGRCTLMQVDPCPCANDPDECCDACSGEQWLCIDASDLGDCGLVAGRTFTSLDQLECGLGPKGPELCNWTVAFGLDGTFMWMHSDVGEGGTYACAIDAVVTITEGPQVAVGYDVDADILTWDGVQYQ